MCRDDLAGYSRRHTFSAGLNNWHIPTAGSTLVSKVTASDYRKRQCSPTLNQPVRCARACTTRRARPLTRSTAMLLTSSRRTPSRAGAFFATASSCSRTPESSFRTARASLLAAPSCSPQLCTVRPADPQLLIHPPCEPPAHFAPPGYQAIGAGTVTLSARNDVIAPLRADDFRRANRGTYAAFAQPRTR